jgi:hypothetical protein
MKVCEVYPDVLGEVAETKSIFSVTSYGCDAGGRKTLRSTKSLLSNNLLFLKNKNDILIPVGYLGVDSGRRLHPESSADSA